MVDFVAPVPIEAKTASRELTIVVAGADEFDQPFKTAERRRRICVQIEDHLMVDHLGVFARDRDESFRRKRTMGHAMRNETDGLMGPKQLVEGPGRVLVRDIDDYA